VAGQPSEKTVGFRVLAGVLIPFLTSIAKIEFTDPQKLPKTGAFVLSPNHYSNIDPVIMGWAMWKLGRAPRFLAKASLFRVPVMGAVLRGTGQIPVERAGSVRGSQPLEAANALAANGNAVIIYPEGTLTRDPQIWPMKGKTGAVRMALEQNLPIIPAAHWGTQAVMGRYSNKISLFPRKTIRVAIGDPVDLDAFRGKPINAALLSAATELVMADITSLLEGLRGETAPVERWNPAAHNQKETGRFE
jgi:1-acyl-sn-glycerol-3-phosphate acyltransferase